MHLRHPVNIRQSMIFKGNAVNAKFNFKISYIFIIISLADKPLDIAVLFKYIKIRSDKPSYPRTSSKSNKIKKRF